MERGFSVVFIFIFATIHLWAIHANNDEVTDALLAFKNALYDPNNNLQSWDAIDPCTWVYVTCSGTNVTRIDLQNKNLAGPLVSELQALTELQFLELYNNQINGSIPKEFGNLANLKSLDLYNNSLSGSIPEELEKLANLTILRLYDNNLTGKAPEFTNVSVVILTNNPGLCGANTDNLICP